MTDTSLDSLNGDDVSALILAGGRSTRMGRDKAFLEIHGEAIIRRTVETLRHFTDDILIVGRASESHLPAPAVPDAIPNAGPMGGLATGLKLVRHRYVACVSCDLPFLDARVLQLLFSRSAAADAVVPRVRDRAQPLHAIYDRAILAKVRARVDSRRLSMHGLLDDIRVCWVGENDLRSLDPELRSFINVNTPEDWDSVRSIAWENGRSDETDV